MQVTTAKAREKFSTLINRAAFGKERIILVRRGEEVAVVMPIEDLRLLEEMEKRELMKDLRDAVREAKEGEVVPWNELKAELGL